LGEDEQARLIFEGVLSGPCPLDATKLQLIRMYSRKQETVDQAARLADEIFTAARNVGVVSNSVVLAAVEQLPWGRGAWRRALFDRHAELIEREIRTAAEGGSDQAFAAFASVGRHWVWHDPERLIDLLATVPLKDPTLADDRACVACGEILQQAAKATELPNRDLQVRALAYFRAVQHPDDFALQKTGALLVEMDRESEAEEVLRSISRLETNPWAQYWLSKAVLVRDASQSLALIDSAIVNLGQGQDRFLSAFYAQRFEARHALGDNSAAEDLRQALRVCDNGKFRSVLERRLMQAESAPASS
jgi:hypothetical protein